MHRPGHGARTTLSVLKPEAAATGMLTASAVMMLPAALILGGAPDLTLAPRIIGAVAYYAIGATALAYLLCYRVLRMAGAGNLLLCTLLVAPISILLGANDCHSRRCWASVFWGPGLRTSMDASCAVSRAFRIEAHARTG